MDRKLDQRLRQHMPLPPALRTCEPGGDGSLHAAMHLRWAHAESGTERRVSPGLTWVRGLLVENEEILGFELHRPIPYSRIWNIYQDCRICKLTDALSPPARCGDEMRPHAPVRIQGTASAARPRRCAGYRA